MSPCRKSNSILQLYDGHPHANIPIQIARGHNGVTEALNLMETVRLTVVTLCNILVSTSASSKKYEAFYGFLLSCRAKQRRLPV